jgi:carboxyl-terminal processing protease
MTFRLSRHFRAAVILGALSACAHPSSLAVRDAPIATDIATATFDSLWTKVANTYVDTSFVSHDWLSARESLRPRALAVTTRSQLDAVLADALHRIPDSHFYIIGSHVAPDETQNKSDARGTSGVSVRVADGRLVVWQVDPGSAAADAGMHAGEIVHRVKSRDAESALNRLSMLSDAAHPRALAEMLQSFNAALNAAVGDTIHIETEARSYALVARPAQGTVSQFGNLPPIAALVRSSRVKTSTSHGCAGVIAFNFWLPMMSEDLAKAVDSVRGCDGIVIDLRGNPGGIGAMVLGFGGYFVDSMRSLGTMRTREVTLNFVISPRAQQFSGKVAILVDPMSASTSEIFATGMQRIGRAKVFGEPSAGAALPAMMERLPSGDVFVHAVADFTDPTGKRVEGTGVVPDVVVPLRISDLKQGRDRALDAAIQWIEKSTE